MTNTQKLLVDLLSEAIRKGNPNIHITKDTNFKALLEESRAHQVQALLYHVLRGMDTLQTMDDDVMCEWKKEAIINGIMQTKHIQQVKKVLYAFNEKGIDVIVLKGLVLREFYPQQELRTMIDADLLVHKKDVEKTRNLLLQMGYIVDNTTPMHIRFDHPRHLTVEVHWTLTDERYITETSDFEDRIWDASVSYEICGAPCRTLSLEDQVVHLCLHMATHIVSSGFGLRQLCDLVLFVEANSNKINFYSVCEKSEKCGMNRFVPAIFIICNRLFGMSIPEFIYCNALYDDKYLNILAKDIFAGGVYGKRNLTCMYSSELGRNSGGKGVEVKVTRVKSFLYIFFPTIDNLSDKYHFVKRCILLTPAAWVHHIICGIFNNNYSLIEKLKFMVCSLFMAKKRSKLLQWLGLY